MKNFVNRSFGIKPIKILEKNLQKCYCSMQCEAEFKDSAVNICSSRGDFFLKHKMNELWNITQGNNYCSTDNVLFFNHSPP
jgi:hypothetical protein